MMLEDFGLEPERFRIEWIASSEAQKFADVMTDMTEALRAWARARIVPGGKREKDWGKRRKGKSHDCRHLRLTVYAFRLN